jgi:hypothetical protein
MLLLVFREVGELQVCNYCAHVAYMLNSVILKLEELYILTSWSIVNFEKLIVSQLVKKFPAFCGTRRYITVFKTVRHFSPS